MRKIHFDKNDRNILICNGIILGRIDNQETIKNLEGISRTMAIALQNYTHMQNRTDYIDGEVAFYIYWNVLTKRWRASFCRGNINLKHFKTLEKAELAAKLLNDFMDENPEVKLFGILEKHWGLDK